MTEEKGDDNWREEAGWENRRWIEVKMRLGEAEREEEADREWPNQGSISHQTSTNIHSSYVDAIEHYVFPLRLRISKNDLICLLQSYIFVIKFDL